VSNVLLFERVNHFLGRDNNQFQSFVGIIEELLKLGEEYKQENELMAEKHAEKDIAFVELKIALDKGRERIKELEMNQEILLDQNKKFRKRIFELREKTGFKVYEENLALIQEIEWYKEMLKGDDHGYRNQAELSKMS
jgi:hypothetical protein